MVGRRRETKESVHHDQYESDDAANIEEDSCCFPICQRRSSAKIPEGDRPERKPCKLIYLVFRDIYMPEVNNIRVCF